MISTIRDTGSRNLEKHPKTEGHPVDPAPPAHQEAPMQIQTVTVRTEHGDVSAAVFGDEDNNPSVKFRPASFLCKSCQTRSPALVADKNTMKCFHCGSAVSLAREKISVWFIVLLNITGCIGILSTSEEVDDSRAAEIIIIAVVFLLAGLFASRVSGDRITQRLMPNFREVSVSPRGYLLLLLLGLTLWGISLGFRSPRDRESTLSKQTFNCIGNSVPKVRASS